MQPVSNLVQAVHRSSLRSRAHSREILHSRNNYLHPQLLRKDPRIHVVRSNSRQLMELVVSVNRNMWPLLYSTGVLLFSTKSYYYSTIDYFLYPQSAPQFSLPKKNRRYLSLISASQFMSRKWPNKFEFSVLFKHERLLLFGTYYRCQDRFKDLDIVNLLEGGMNVLPYWPSQYLWRVGLIVYEALVS